MEPIFTRRLWRSLALALLVAAAAGGLMMADWRQSHQSLPPLPASQPASLATAALAQLPVHPAASKAGYSRKQFGGDWAKTGECTMRDKILARDMTAVRYRSPTDCTVLAGTLDDPYTGKTIHFIRGPRTSAAVQIDHVVAISDTWQTGAQQLSKAEREQLYNDPLELLAGDGPANEQKSDSDAAGWLPPNTGYNCRYVARQIAVKRKYRLWTTAPEHAAMEKALKSCPNQLLPVVKG